jgi:hypothetical protein
MINTGCHGMKIWLGDNKTGGIPVWARANPHGARRPPQPGHATKLPTRSDSTFTGSFSTTGTDALRHHPEKDLLVLGEEIARGSLRVQDVLTLSPPKRHRKHAHPPHQPRPQPRQYTAPVPNERVVQQPQRRQELAVCLTHLGITKDAPPTRQRRPPRCGRPLPHRLVLRMALGGPCHRRGGCTHPNVASRRRSRAREQPALRLEFRRRSDRTRKSDRWCR